MHASAHKRSDRIVDQTVAFDSFSALKCRGDDADPVVPAFARAGVSRMRRAVVDNIELYRRKTLHEEHAQLPDAIVVGALHGQSGAALVLRTSQASCTATNTKVAAVNPKTLKYTQMRSGALKATIRLSNPSSA